MNNQKSDIALLIFGLTAKEEALRKSFVKDSFHKNLLIAQTLFQQTNQLAKRLNLDVICSNEKLQQGQNFAERLVFDMERSFQMGYKKLIVIGTDCPSLTTQHIESAVSSLQNGNSVLGPDLDGGIYLLGIKANQFNKSDFLNFSWQTNKLVKELANHLESSLLLEPLKDIDNAQDLISYLQKSYSDHLKKLFLYILKGEFCFNRPINTLKQYKNSLGFIYFRGPPITFRTV